MTARAIVTRYNNETVLLNGDFTVDAIVLLTDPARPGGTNDGLMPIATSADGIVLVAATPAAWAGAIENAVIAKAVSLGFTDLVAINTFIPTIA